ncbi:hypothetical protein G6F68_016209 [Rhizopus microsporus]|nr:hypothetical protein G6F68_016209 [Rhizopus microsporus]
MYLEVQVRGLGAGIAGAADVADHLAALDHLLFRQPIGIALQVRVVVAPASAGFELVDRQAAALAVEQLFYGAISHGQHRRPGVGHDVDGIVCEASMPCTGSNRPVGVPLALADGATDAEGAASTCAAAGAFTGVAATVGCGAGGATATG